MSIIEGTPAFKEQDAVRFTKDLYGIEAAAESLPGERDQNFLLLAEPDRRYVLKIANAAEQIDILDLQNRAMQYVGRDTDLCPRIRAATDGREIVEVSGADGTKHFVRLLTYIPGIPLGRVNPHTSELLADLGRFLGHLDLKFQGFTHPALDRDLYWDMKNAHRVIESYRKEIDRKQRRILVDRYTERFEADVFHRLVGLRTAVIHNDANDYNVLVGEPSGDDRQITGIIDFGDMVQTALAAEPAVAAAYAMMDKPDPLKAASSIIRGYHEIVPLTEDELSLIFDMICIRLCMSVCISAHQKKQRPGDAYLVISERPAWDCLSGLIEIEPDFAHYTFRQAVGLTACPKTTAVVGWLKKNRNKIGRIVEPNLQDSTLVVFDLSPGSLELAELGDGAGIDAFECLLSDKMASAGARVGIGRYNEIRRVYTSDLFKPGDDESLEWRTLHLGIDLFMEACSPVYAPLDGTVHSFQNNANPLDYGPTIILRHDADGLPFYTLYGHLRTDSLDGLVEGRAIKKGQAFAWIGQSEENGGWPPHLHFQLITDLLGRTGEFPGVAAPGQGPVWLSLCPDPNLFLRVPDVMLQPTGMKAEDILSIRRAHLGPSLSISYQKPLHIVRGSMQFLYDADGQPYLDAVNNVPHVGHSHPRIVRASRDQMPVLNTNTRYLHENLVQYIRRLCEKVPESLRVCYILNSGSEANDLALRLARAHTRQTDTIVVDGAYHGNLTSLIEISPYKFNGPGGQGAPGHVHTVPMPDIYRGLYRDDPSAGKKYARHVRDAVDEIQKAGRNMAAFISESLLGCGGQIVLPDHYLEHAYRYTREAGGVCIADEVQVGFGRVGSHFWGFETQSVIPDIITLGKPIGNGHPLAAVITTPEIAASFDTGMEYFNTYGGNPVSCAVGLAVLDVIEEERLQENALKVGSRLIEGLKALMDRHPVIGDVRGLGLFIGVELVACRDARTPAGDAASYVTERMRDHRILISTDGPERNVLKIKPPLVFTQEDADRLLRTLDRILGEDPVTMAYGNGDRGFLIGIRK